jgi:hypothetical protein
MTLAAMMVSGRGFANVVTLATTDTWVATVTGTVFVTIASPGGQAGPNTVSGRGGGGGGGGAYIGIAPLAVVTGDTITTTFAQIIANNVQLATQLTFAQNGTPVSVISSGRDAGNVVQPDWAGGFGGSLTWDPLGIQVSGGDPGFIGGGGAPADGQNGGEVFAGGGAFIGGGGGGSGNLVSPPASGTPGGLGGTVYLPIPPVSFWGGGGGGFQSGSARFGANVNEVTSPGSWIIRIEW